MAHRDIILKCFLSKRKKKKNFLFFWTENYMLCWNRMVVSSDYIFFPHFWFHSKVQKIPDCSLHLLPFLLDTKSLVCWIKRSFNIKLTSFIPIPEISKTNVIMHHFMLWVCTWELHVKWVKAMMCSHVTLITDMGKRNPGSNPTVITFPPLWNEWAAAYLWLSCIMHQYLMVQQYEKSHNH